MTIDMISNTSISPRPSLPEIGSTTARQPGVQAKPPEEIKPAQLTEIRDKKVLDKAEVEQAVDKISEFVSALQSELSFSIDDATGSQIVKIMDSQTQQVIRQFPSEEAVAIAHALDKLQGLLIKDKA